MEEKEFSLLHPMATGGIFGGAGYTFQDRYIVCHIPRWLTDPNFIRFMSEASGDVDIVFKNGTDFFYDHIQVKDHNVTKGEFKEILAAFVKIDIGMKRVYRHFILTSPSISSDVQALANALFRYKEAVRLFDLNDMKALETTKSELITRVEELGIKEHEKFILEKLNFEIGKFDFNDNGNCKRMFISTLVEHPVYKDYVISILHPVYSKLIEEVLAHRGKVMEHDQIHSLIKGVLSAMPQTMQENVLHLHNWTNEKFSPDATLTIDWSIYFDRSTRSVPDAVSWNTQLIPQLTAVRQDLAKITTNRHIIFRGKCALSSGFALGMAFPEIGNWTFEVQQYSQVWRSDAEKLKDYNLKYESVNPEDYGLATDNSEIAVIFNITGKALDDVVSHLKDSGTAVKQLVLIHPSANPGNLSIQSDSEAVALASASKDIIKEMLTRYKSKKTHLFYFGPLGLSIFLGQKLTSVGQIQLYEFQDPGYKESCLIKT